MCTLRYKNDDSLFSNVFSFLRFPLEYDPYNKSSDWVITGVPFDMATSGRSGSRFGPTAIRQASINLVWEHCRWPWNYDIRKKLRIIDCGDLVYPIGSILDFSNILQKHAEKLLFAKKKLFSLGGDHFITLPILRAYSKFFDKISIVHFDAHTDNYSDNKFDHGSIMTHAVVEKLIDFNHSVQIGIRTAYNKNLGFTVLHADYINSHSISVIVNKIISVVQSLPVYLTFDIDCLDPSVAPGTGTPVIGGLTTYCALRLIRELKRLNIIGMDLVEVAPIYDHSQITALAAATLGLEMLYIQVPF